MTLTRELAQAQAARLQASPMLCPQSKEGRQEIVDCLLRNCQDAEHARESMTALLDNALHVNGPITAYIADIARQTRRSDIAPPGCSRCDNGLSIQDGSQQWAMHVEQPNGGFARCDCTRGRWLAAKDGEAKAATGKKEERIAKRRAAIKPIEPRDGRKMAAGDK